MGVFFTADTHFDQERTRVLSRRPYKTTEDMTVDLINKWNTTIKPDDLVFHLGDFGNYEDRQYLNGKIILICGNYESGISDDELLSYGFDEVYRETYNIKYNGNIITMQHEPRKIKDQRHLSESGIINLYGHVHKLCMVKECGLCVSTDCHNFRPIDFETIEFYVNGIKKLYYNYDVFM